MGFWEFVSSGTDAVKQNAPDLTSLKDACKSSYGYGAAAATKIEKLVRVDGLQKINGCMPDEKTRAQIGLFASKFASNTAGYAVKEGYKWVPGGKAVAEIISDTIRDVKLENESSNQEQAFTKDIAGGKWESGNYSTSRNVLHGVEVQCKGMQLGSAKPFPAYPYPVQDQKPEDVLRVFMMKEFIGTRFLDDLVIPHNRSGKRNSKGNFVQ